jgi:hypothetical protein
MIAQFASADDARSTARYWQVQSRESLPGAPAMRLAAATNHVAWVRESGSWAPVKVVAVCVRGHS